MPNKAFHATGLASLRSARPARERRRWVSMKAYLLVLLAVLPSAVLGEEVDPRQTYLSYEAAYRTNDAERVDKWLSQDVKLTQTLHLPSGEASTVAPTRAQVLDGMRQSKGPNKTPLSTFEDVTIDSKKGDAFCGQSSTTKETIVSGVAYEEKEIRRVCFAKVATSYQVRTQTIDVFYKRK